MRQITLSSVTHRTRWAMPHRQSISTRGAELQDVDVAADSIIDILRDSATCTGSVAVPLMDWTSVANFAQVYNQPF